MLKRNTTHTSILDLTSYIKSHNLAWSDINLYVKAHQKQIYQHACTGDTSKVHSCQQLLFISKEASILALRHIINTSSQFKFSSKRATNDFLFLNSGSSSVLRRITSFLYEEDKYILNLVIQELLLIVLRPEWEARLEDNSYGFSSNWAVNQAIIKTYGILSENRAYENSTILVGNLSNWFHEFDLALILKKGNLNSDLIRYLESICSDSLLSSSYKLANKNLQSIDIPVFLYNSIFLLLSRILFYGLEISLQWKSRHFCNDENSIKTIVFSNHFAVIFPYNDLKWISLIVNTIKSFFDSLRLDLHNSSFSVRSIDEGFNFLGFNFRRYQNEEPWNHQKTKIILRPTSNNIKKHLLSIRYCLYHKDRLNRWRSNAQMTQYDVINKLNPLIKDFSQYYFDLVPSYILNTLDRTVNELVYRYATKKYKSNKSKKWDDNWTVVVNGKKVIAYKNYTDKGCTQLCLHNLKSVSKIV